MYREISFFIGILIFHHIYGKNLILSNRRDIRIISLESPYNYTVLFDKLDDVVALDFDYRENFIFWSDINYGAIFRADIKDINNLKIKKIIWLGLKSPEGIVCDWIRKKLYWTDSVLNRIEVSNYDGTLRKIIYWRRLDQPISITLDIIHGHIFWAVWGEKPSIEMGAMDGGDRNTNHFRQIIVQNETFYPSGLAIYYSSFTKQNLDNQLKNYSDSRVIWRSRLLWLDTKLNYIASVNGYDGTDKRIHLDGLDSLPYPYALTMAGNQMYWTDWKLRSVQTCPIDSMKNKEFKMEDFRCNKTQTLVSGLYSPTDIHYYDEAAQPLFDNTCGVNNGGCSHLCLMSPNAPYYSCACPTGIKLKSDNKTCYNGMIQFLLLARRTDLRIISLDTKEYLDVIIPLNTDTYSPPKHFPNDANWLDSSENVNGLDNYNNDNNIPYSIKNASDSNINYIISNNEPYKSIKQVPSYIQLKNAISLDYDPVTQSVLWSDTTAKGIYAAHLNGSHYRQIVSTNVISPDGIAVDWLGRNLYWTDAGTDSIQVTKLLDTSNNMDIEIRKILIQVDGLDQPRGITLDPYNGFIYWTDWGRTPRIEKSWLDGSHRQILASGLDLGWPNGIVVDYLVTHKVSSSDGNFGLNAYSINTNNKIWDSKMNFSPEKNKPNTNLKVFKQLNINQENILVNTNPWIYWNDALKDRIEAIRSDGTQRRIIVSQNIPHSFGLSLIDNTLYWTDWQRRLIECCDKNGKNRKVIIRELPDLMGLKAVDTINGFKGTNACSFKNGGCQQYCFVIPSFSNATTSQTNHYSQYSNPSQFYRCDCGEEYELGIDGKSCILSTSNFLLFSHEQALSRVTIGTLLPKVSNINPITFLENMNKLEKGKKGPHSLQSLIKQASAIEIDSFANEIYWADIDHKIICRAPIKAMIDETDITIIIDSGLEMPSSLALDWLAGNVYWADMNTNRIEMGRAIDGAWRKTIIWQDIINPRSIALDPVKGFLFWNTWASQEPRIEMSALDGTNRRILIKGQIPFESTFLWDTNNFMSTHASKLFHEPTDKKSFHNGDHNKTLPYYNRKENPKIKMGRANALTLDPYDRSFLFWIDLDYNAIMYIPLSDPNDMFNVATIEPKIFTLYDNKQQKTIYPTFLVNDINQTKRTLDATNNLFNPFALSLFPVPESSLIGDNYGELLDVFWSDWNTRCINKMRIIWNKSIQRFIPETNPNKMNVTYITNLSYVIDMKAHFNHSAKDWHTKRFVEKLKTHKKCQHFYMYDASQANGITCYCSTHYRINGSVCLPPTRYFLLSEKDKLHRVMFEGDDNLTLLNDPVETIIPLQNIAVYKKALDYTNEQSTQNNPYSTLFEDNVQNDITAIAYDYRDKYIYWIDFGVIWRQKENNDIKTIQMLLPNFHFIHPNPEILRKMRLHHNNINSKQNIENSINKSPSIISNNFQQSTTSSGTGNGINEIYNYFPYDMVIYPVTRQFFWTCLRTKAIYLNWMDDRNGNGAGAYIGSIISNDNGYEKLATQPEEFDTKNPHFQFKHHINLDIAPTILTMDYVSGYIYWVNDLLFVQEFIHKNIASSNNRIPLGYGGPAIERILYDGTKRTLIVPPTNRKSHISSITFDTVNRRLYWADAKFGVIENCDALGGDRSIISATTTNPIALALVQGRNIYWLDSKEATHINSVTIGKGAKYTKSPSYNDKNNNFHKTGHSLTNFQSATRLMVIDHDLWMWPNKTSYSTAIDMNGLKDWQSSNFSFNLAIHPCSYLYNNGNCSDICISPAFSDTNAPNSHNTILHKQFVIHPIVPNQHTSSQQVMRTPTLYLQNTVQCSCPLNKILIENPSLGSNTDSTKRKKKSRTNTNQKLKFCQNKPRDCPNDQFKCLAGAIDCIPLTWKCDGSPDCEDSSDESVTTCKNKNNPLMINANVNQGAKNIKSNYKIKSKMDELLRYNAQSYDVKVKNDVAANGYNEEPLLYNGFGAFDCSLYGGHKHDLFRCHQANPHHAILYPAMNSNNDGRTTAAISATTSSWLCVRDRARCDTYIDCPDASDEIDCGEHEMHAHSRAYLLSDTANYTDPFSSLSGIKNNILHIHKYGNKFSASSRQPNNINNLEKLDAKKSNTRSLSTRSTEMRYALGFIGMFVIILLIAMFYASFRHRCTPFGNGPTNSLLSNNNLDDTMQSGRLNGVDYKHRTQRDNYFDTEEDVGDESEPVPIGFRRFNQRKLPPLPKRGGQINYAVNSTLETNISIKTKKSGKNLNDGTFYRNLSQKNSDVSSVRMPVPPPPSSFAFNQHKKSHGASSLLTSSSYFSRPQNLGQRNPLQLSASDVSSQLTSTVNSFNRKIHEGYEPDIKPLANTTLHANHPNATNSKTTKTKVSVSSFYNVGHHNIKSAHGIEEYGENDDNSNLSPLIPSLINAGAPLKKQKFQHEQHIQSQNDDYFAFDNHSSNNNNSNSNRNGNGINGMGGYSLVGGHNHAMPPAPPPSLLSSLASSVGFGFRKRQPSTSMFSAWYRNFDGKNLYGPHLRNELKTISSHAPNVMPTQRNCLMNSKEPVANIRRKKKKTLNMRNLAEKSNTVFKKPSESNNPRNMVNNKQNGHYTTSTSSNTSVQKRKNVSLFQTHEPATRILRQQNSSTQFFKRYFLQSFRNNNSPVLNDGSFGVNNIKIQNEIPLHNGKKYYHKKHNKDLKPRNSARTPKPLKNVDEIDEQDTTIPLKNDIYIIPPPAPANSCVDDSILAKDETDPLQNS